jgi:hypothetical protein
MAYSSSPFAAPPALLLPGQVAYSIGSFNDRVPSTKFFVTQSAIASNVATITGTIWEGPVPVAGQLISTQGLQNIPDVTNVAIATVTISAITGAGTITYADTNADVATAADSCLAIIPQSIALVAPAATTVASYGNAFALQAIQGNNSRSIAWGTVVSGGTVSAVEFDLQGAINNIDGEYFELDKSTSTSGETRVFTPTSQVNFLRIKATVTYTGSPKIASFLGI